MTAETTDQAVQCLKCKVGFEKSKVNITYLNNTFSVELLQCPGCGQIYVTEELALGRMAEVEKALEDK
jgi:transcription elongation factor Elf1